MNIKEILTGARGHVETGWCQGHMGHGPDGGVLGQYDDMGGAERVCTIGALFKTTTNVYARDLAARALFAALPGDLGVSGSYFAASLVAQYNDRETTTQQDVLALYDRAIEHASTDEIVEPKVEWPTFSFSDFAPKNGWFVVYDECTIVSAPKIKTTFKTPKAKPKSAKGAPAMPAFIRDLLIPSGENLPAKLSGEPDWQRLFPMTGPPTVHPQLACAA